MSDFFINERLQKLGKSQTELATILGFPASVGNKLARGARTLRGNELYTVAKFLNYNVEDFARYVSGETDIRIRDADQSGVGFVRIPYYNAVASAGTGVYTDTEYAQSYIDVSHGKFADKLRDISRCVAITVKGDSMEPLLHDGDIVVVDTDERAREIVEGRIYVINIKDQLYIKRLFINPIQKMFVLRSENSLYPQLDVMPDDIKICGRLVMRVFEEI